MKSIKAYIRKIKSVPMYSDLVFILRGSSLACVIAFVISCLWGFDLRFLSGLAVGFLYLTFNYVFLALSICGCADTGDTKKAKKMILGSYMLRYFALFLLCWVAFEVKIISVVGIILPQFFPRIILWINHILKRGNGHGRT